MITVAMLVNNLMKGSLSKVKEARVVFSVYRNIELDTIESMMVPGNITKVISKTELIDYLPKVAVVLENIPEIPEVAVLDVTKPNIITVIAKGTAKGWTICKPGDFHVTKVI